MSWRWQPPVLSPVSTRGLIDGLSAVVGMRPGDDRRVIEALSARYNAPNVLLTNSGTSALILALTSTRRSGGTVALPGYGCVDLTAAAIGAGMKVRLYDLDPRTLSPDLDSVRGVLARGVDALVVAHLYGYPADVPGVQGLADEHGVRVIEDAAQAAGGSLNNRLLGSLGDTSILSFGRGKGMTAGGGGALLARTAELAERMTPLHDELGAASSGALALVTLAAQSMLARPSLYRLPASLPGLKLGEMVYKPPRAARSLPAASAALLLSALAMDDAEVKRRQQTASRLLDILSRSNALQAVRAIVCGKSGYLRLAAVDTRGGKLPHRSIGAVRGYPLTLGEHPQLQSRLLPGERAGKGSETLRNKLFTLPTHSRVTDADLARLDAWAN